MDIRQEIIRAVRNKLRKETRFRKGILNRYQAAVKTLYETGAEISNSQLNRVAEQVSNSTFTFQITTNPKETIDSIIMGQVSGIKSWDIEARLVKSSKGSKKVPMWKRTGAPIWRTATQPRHWKLYKAHNKLPFVDIIRETKHSLIGSIDIQHLQIVIDKLSHFGVVRINFK